MEENKEILELLKQIDKSSRQQARSAKVQCVFALITAVCCVVLFVMIWNVLPQLNEVITQMQTVLGNLELTTEQLASIDLAGMVSNVDSLVVSGQDSLEQTMEKLNTIDFETLNQAIEDLAAVIEPIANFFNVFN